MNDRPLMQIYYFYRLNYLVFKWNIPGLAVKNLFLAKKVKIKVNEMRADTYCYLLIKIK